MKTTESSNSNGKKYFMVFVCMLLQAIPYGVAQNIQPMFVPYVVNKFNFSLASFSLIFTFGAIASAICSPFFGKLYGKVNVKILFMTGAIIASFGFMAFGFARNLPQFYLVSAISLAGSVLGYGLCLPYVINSWFPGKGRGRALGIAFSGGSIGNTFLQPLTSNMLASRGVTQSYVFCGLLALAVSVLIVLVIRVPRPGELQPETVENNSDAPKEKASFEGLGIKGTIASKNFWVFAVGFGLLAIPISALSTQYATYFVNELHLNAALVGTIGTTFAIFCLIGNLLGGVLFDKIGSFRTMLIAGILLICSPIALLVSKSFTPLAFTFSVIFGIDVFSYTMAPSYLSVDLFGKKDSSSILGATSLVFALGFAFGSTLFGLITDNFGFQTAWIAMVGVAVVGFILLLSGILMSKAQMKKYMAQ